MCHTLILSKLIDYTLMIGIHGNAIKETKSLPELHLNRLLHTVFISECDISYECKLTDFPPRTEPYEQGKDIS